MGGGDVGATPQEKTLASISAAQFQDYSTRFLPVQDHLANVVSDMGAKDSWQRLEAEGKGNVDASVMFANEMTRQTSTSMSRGINVGSPAFNLSVAGAATSEAQAKGFAVQRGNEAIDRAYLQNLTGITRAGSRLAGAAVTGMGPAAETASREAITADQVASTNTAADLQIAGGAVGFAGGAYATGMFNGPGGISGPGATLGDTTYPGGVYQPGLNVNGAGAGYPGFDPSLAPGGIR